MTMKKFLLFAVATAAIMLTSCDVESSHHQMGIVYPSPYSYGFVYADQKADSLVFLVTDDFRLMSLSSWISVPDSMKDVHVENIYMLNYIIKTPVFFDANTTGSIRKGELNLISWGKEEGDVASAYYMQCPWHNIQRPEPLYSYNDSNISNAKFELTDSATQECDTLRFTTYENWTLTDGEFAHPAKLSGKPGNQTVLLAIDPNATAEERTATIVLESRGVKTNIFVKQEGKKE